jgi:hypothetical protein
LRNYSAKFPLLDLFYYSSGDSSGDLSSLDSFLLYINAPPDDTESEQEQQQSKSNITPIRINI